MNRSLSGRGLPGLVSLRFAKWTVSVITSMRAKIAVDYRTGLGSVSYRSKGCQWDRCFEENVQDQLKNCRPTVGLE